MASNNEYYFTFGVDCPLADFVQQVSAPDVAAARRGMRRFYENRWAFIYRAEECFFPAGEGNRVVFPGGATLQKIPRKIVVDGDEIYVE